MAISEFASNTASGTGTVSAGTSFTVDKPSGCVEGDLVVVVVVTSDNIGGFSSSDLTELFEVNEAGLDSGMWIGWRVVGASDGSTYTINSTNTESYVYTVIALRGAEIGSASDCVGNATNTSQVTPSINVTDSAAWIVCAWGSDGPAPGPTRTPPASPFIEALDVADATTGVGVMIGYEDLAGSTGSKSRTCTSDQNDVYLSAIIEIAPSSGAPPTTFPTTSIIDNGTSPVENPITTDWDGPLISGQQPLQRTSTGIARGSANGGSYVDLGNYGPNIEVYASIAVLTASTGTADAYLYARVQGEGSALIDGYAVRLTREVAAGTDNMKIIRTDDSGTDVVLGSYVVGTIVPGTDKYGMSIVGDQLIGYYDNGSGWAVVITAVTDSTYALAGKLAVQMVRGDTRLTDIGGGTILPEKQTAFYSRRRSW